ncbi:hypothetical protein GDO81_013029 [Engystomops pustulosus]|uniref:Secreted protein n=1 Tax=Engystomops pustulosus TaxID=76066 RepID=A0AAV7AYP1_ENGPU|nr:hypothetical protein GDO81_013029 [Engystomops pustulosus]
MVDTFTCQVFYGVAVFIFLSDVSFLFTVGRMNMMEGASRLPGSSVTCRLCVSCITSYLSVLRVSLCTYKTLLLLSCGSFS